MNFENVNQDIIRIDSDNLKCGFENEISRISKELDKGKLIIYPTETVYGLGVDIQNVNAMKKLYHVKKRETSKQISVIAADTQMVLQYVENPNRYARDLMDMFWPGPLTIVFPVRKDKIVKRPEMSCTIGIRVPGNSFCRNLARKFGSLISATSANLSGEKECMSVDRIHPDVINSVDIIVDGGELRNRVPSTVISVVNEHPVLLRDGAVPWKKIENCLGGDLL